MSPDTLHEYAVEVALGTIHVTSFGLTRDAAVDAAMPELRARLEAAFDTGTWFIHDCGPVEMEDALQPQEGQTDGGLT